MKFQKSPFPYIILLTVIVASALYSNFTIDREITKPIVYKIQKQLPLELTSLDTKNVQLVAFSKH